MHEVRRFVLIPSAASYALAQRGGRTTSRSRTRTRSAIVSKDTFRNGISNIELGGLFGGGGSGGGEVTKVATLGLHIMLLLGGLRGLKAVEGSRGLKVVDSFALFFGIAF